MDADVTLEVLGWDARWAEVWAAHHRGGDAERVPARVVLEHQHIYRVHTGTDEVLARVTGRVRHKLGSREAFPAVGDWIALKPAGPAEEMGRIVDVLPRRGQFVRKAAGTTTEAQVVAANVDVVFLVSGLDHDFNVRRIERYLLAALEGGAAPVVVLNKADLPRDIAQVRAGTRSRRRTRAGRTGERQIGRRASTRCAATSGPDARRPSWGRPASASRR